MVAISLIRLRSTQPQRLGRFRVPLGGVRIGGLWFGVVPVLAILMSFAMTLPVALDIVRQARNGDLLPVVLLTVYAVIGGLLYRFYGRARALQRNA
jgi:APA family basic amino acid/polyamine antiporter